MPIEFRCSGCNQLLRVPETAAGQQAKCPNCAAVQTIPAASTVAPPPPPPVDSANPFAAPSPIREEYFAGAMPGDSERTGPPWERDGKSFMSYWNTLKLVITDPVRMFSTMNRDGGLASPILYSLCYVAVGMTLFLLIMLGVMAFATASKGGVGALATAGGGMVCIIALTPLFAIAWLIISAGIMHISLMLVGGAKQPFETTFRVVAYVSGSTYWIGLIPYIGGLIAFVAQIVYTIFGFMHAHEISGGKATLAVLLPALCCCGLIIFGFMTFFVIGLSAH